MKWTIQEKIQTDPPLIWNEDMEFPGVSKKQHVEFPGGNVCGISRGLLLALEFPRDLTQFCGI